MQDMKDSGDRSSVDTLHCYNIAIVDELTWYPIVVSVSPVIYHTRAQLNATRGTRANAQIIINK